MKYDRIALFTDLDGTLFNSNRKVSDENRTAIERFISEGGCFGISTGRAPDNALNMLPGLKINSWSVVLNGAEAYHFTEKRAAAQSCLPKEIMEKLFRWVYQNLPEVNIQLCTDTELLFLSRPEFGDEDFITTHQPMRETSVEEALGYPWLKVLFCAPRPILMKLHEYAVGQGMTAVMDSVYTNEVYLEFLPLHANKGTCLHQLRELPEMQNRVFVAIGDYTNDIELLQEADVAVAVGNALQEVKAVADHVVCTNDEHALAYLIDVLIPKL